MSLAKNAALFVGSALVEREVEFTDGTLAMLHFGKVSGLEWSQYQFAMAAGDEASRARAALRLAMLSLREPDGKQALQWDDVLRLDPGVAQQIISHAAEVCRPNPKARKESPPKESDGSGTS